MGESKKVELRAKGLVKADLCAVALLRAEEDRLAAEALGYGGREREAAAESGGVNDEHEHDVDDAEGEAFLESVVNDEYEHDVDNADSESFLASVAADEAEVARIKAALKSKIGELKADLEQANVKEQLRRLLALKRKNVLNEVEKEHLRRLVARKKKLALSGVEKEHLRRLMELKKDKGPTSMQESMERVFSGLFDALNRAIDPEGAKRHREEQQLARRNMGWAIASVTTFLSAWLLWRVAAALRGGNMPSAHVEEAGQVLSALRKRQQAKCA